MNLTRTVNPISQPVSLSEAKSFMRVDHNDQDDLILGLIETATMDAESFCNRQFITATYTLSLPRYPLVIYVPQPPLQSVTMIQYEDTVGVTQTEASSVYTVTISGTGTSNIVEADGQFWSSTNSVPEAVTVTFVAGYGEAVDVPSSIKTAIKMAVTDLYENRGSTTELRLSKNDTTSKILWPYRVGVFS